ncbi:putative efflux protein, MATE family [Peptoclostridium litorale DSM 5388]|uniref:Multidrug export protein MepA n=1 Tax=Peptoclostridium litorale DSM 5388 TaxID=1121324 RepID=A0A069RGY0_PEPLI|nr:MATE family efflux transporter [Peptoclostridium litorale]KDR95430.1 multidrug export protein MepA [Peptoclostridium litorale DSM 5388]SIO18917.1 putative efflux protein, MATE family [Peptoclostridium litorale DSM 5388]
MEKQMPLANEPVGKLLIKFSTPAIVGMLINVLYNIVDRIFIGRGVGPLAISGVGLTFPFMTIIMAFGMLVGIGGAALISIRLGEGKKEEAEKLLGNTFVMLIIVSLGVTAFGLILRDPLLKAFGASAQTFKYAKEYITIILAGTLFNALGFGLNSAIRSDGSPNIAMATNLIGAITNIILDYLFIMKLGLGIKGAAYATLIGQSFNTIWVIKYFIGSRSSIKLKTKNLRLEKRLVMGIFAIGMSPFAIQLAGSVINIIANKALLTYGSDYAVGAMSIMISIAMMFLMPVFGINQGAQPIIGFNYGAAKYDRVKSALYKSIGSATLLSVVGAIAVQSAPASLMRIFTPDADIISIGTGGMKILMLMLPVIGFQIVASNFFQAIGKAKVSLFLSLLRQVIILIPLLLILPAKLGLFGVWVSYPISDMLSSLITLVFLAKEIKTLSNTPSVGNSLPNAS